MALKTLVLRSKLDKLNAQLEKFVEKDADFEAREAELISAVEEMTAETPDEEREIVENKANELDAEKEAHEGEKKRLQDEIAEILSEIEAEEARQAAMKPVIEETNKEEREVKFNNMETRKSNFFGMSVQERDAFFMRNDVQGFLTEIKDLIANKRSINGGKLLIPVTILDLIRENVMDYSKLMRRVRLRQVAGTARQTVMGTVPEAVWVEACGTLNELDFDFTQVQLDGFKVGGYVFVCNTLLRDADIALLSELITGMGQAIGLALDKAILYGKGASQKQPLGIATRIAQQSIPDDYPATARPWVDLHSSHVITINATGATFFQKLVEAEAVCEGVYSRGTKFWAMNPKTYAKVKAQAVATNLYGAYVAEVDGVMPVVGGDIVVLNFIPDNDIICGYGDLYLLAEREGTLIETSREFRFVQDETTIRAISVFDGTPVIAEAFMICNINNSTPTTSLTFADDAANDASLENLQIPGVSIDFAAGTYTYEANIANNVESVSVYPTPAQEGAIVTIKKGTAKYTEGAPIAMAVGENTIKVEVAKGAAKLTYTVVLTRAGL